jgi:large subunit ribosomal protein L32
MGALPKQRVSRARQGNRRRHHFIKLPQLMTCPVCGQKKRTHYVEVAKPRRTPPAE